jgi:hypothetical protein
MINKSAYNNIYALFTLRWCKVDIGKLAEMQNI